MLSPAEALLIGQLALRVDLSLEAGQEALTRGGGAGDGVGRSGPRAVRCSARLQTTLGGSSRSSVGHGAATSVEVARANRGTAASQPGPFQLITA